MYTALLLANKQQIAAKNVMLKKISQQHFQIFKTPGDL